MEPPRPDCLVGFMPMKVERFVSYTLPDVPMEEQTIVLDPEDPQWFFVTRTGDVEALQSWLRWYHQSKRQPRKPRRKQTTPPPT